MANVANTARDQEERRIEGGTIQPRVRDADEKKQRPDLQIITRAETCRDAEEQRLANGQH